MDDFQPVSITALTGSVLAGPSPQTLMTPLEFLARFTDAEKSAITTVALDSAGLMLWLLTAMGASQINIKDQQTIDGVNALVAAKLLTADRAKVILT